MGSRFRETLMRVALVGTDLNLIEEVLPLHGLERDDRSPEAVVSYGGDGALLGAERDYPGIPKLGLRNASDEGGLDNQAKRFLERLGKGELFETPVLKIEAVCGGKTLAALNDVILRNENITSAVRFSVSINGKSQGGEIVGDGLVAATPFGSSAYYRSITHSLFQVGIGLAFNNSTEPVDHMVLREDSLIEVTILRGPAIVAVDNNPERVSLLEGDTFLVRKSSEPARILGIETLRRHEHVIPRSMPPSSL